MLGLLCVSVLFCFQGLLSCALSINPLRYSVCL